MAINAQYINILVNSLEQRTTPSFTFANDMPVAMVLGGEPSVSFLGLVPSSLAAPSFPTTPTSFTSLVVLEVMKYLVFKPTLKLLESWIGLRLPTLKVPF